MDIAKELLAGNRLALSRAITAIENEYPEANDIMKELYTHTGHAYVVGITGPPGAGKSTMTDKIARAYRKKGMTVGIVAVDPSSPFTGGAILGDRIRMDDLTLDKGVFIRSMGTRGSLGGLSHKTADVVKAMDAFGKDIIIVETVGVGQSEVDIVKAADTTMVILIPGMGDDIQAIKAGILEIGDLFVINKSDLDGADKVVRGIKRMLELDAGSMRIAKTATQKALEDQFHHLSVAPKAEEAAPGYWRPPVHKVVAMQNEGIEELVELVGKHRAFIEENGELTRRRTKRAKDEMLDILNARINYRIKRQIVENGRLDAYVESFRKHETDPYTVVGELMEEMLK